MPDGSRTRTGCLTCRIRKKKCDEERPACQACCLRSLPCYGYDKPAPEWFTSKSSWKGVRESPEAKILQGSAREHYKLKRKIQSVAHGKDQDHISALAPIVSTTEAPSSIASTQRSNDQLVPSRLLSRAVWWNMMLQSLDLGPGSGSSEGNRLVLLYTNMIAPITHTFYPLLSPQDRSWFVTHISRNSELRTVVQSISTWFECAVEHPPAPDCIPAQTRNLQLTAVRNIHSNLSNIIRQSSRTIWEMIDVLEAILALASLEIFSTFSGTWQMHHRASRALMDRISRQLDGDSVPLIIKLLSKAADDEATRSLKFSILNFVWLDVISTSTFGLTACGPFGFDYLPLLRSERIDLQSVMGCHTWVAVKMVEIIRLEDDIKTASDGVPTLAHKKEGDTLAEVLLTGIEKMHRIAKEGSNSIQDDISRVSRVFAHAALVLLQVVMRHEDCLTIDQSHVEHCLQALEDLPTRLRIRIAWPYAITGCMSVSESQHARFRRVLAQALEEGHLPGTSRKSLVVMEECWKLRRSQPKRFVSWRETMDSMNARVILM